MPKNHLDKTTSLEGCCQHQLDLEKVIGTIKVDDVECGQLNTTLIKELRKLQDIIGKLLEFLQTNDLEVAIDDQDEELRIHNSFDSRLLSILITTLGVFKMINFTSQELLIRINEALSERR